MLLLLLVILSLAGTTRALYIVTGERQRRNPTQHVASAVSSGSGINKRARPCALAVFLGSGGHTSEALTMISALDFTRYSPRTYIISEGDTLSAKKAIALEAVKGDSQSAYRIVTIPRARKVHQPLASTPFTAAYSFLFCLYYTTVAPILNTLRLRGFEPLRADLLLLNGPGTCFVLAASVALNKFLSLPAPRVVYVETFARVRALSLSGKLLHYIADRFVVQWPDNISARTTGECHGWMV